MIVRLSPECTQGASSRCSANSLDETVPFRASPRRGRRVLFPDHRWPRQARHRRGGGACGRWGVARRTALRPAWSSISTPIAPSTARPWRTLSQRASKIRYDVSPSIRVRHAARSASSSRAARETFLALAAVTQRVSVTAATRRVGTSCAYNSATVRMSARAAGGALQRLRGEWPPRVAHLRRASGGVRNG